MNNAQVLNYLVDSYNHLFNFEPISKPFHLLGHKSVIIKKLVGYEDSISVHMERDVKKVYHKIYSCADIPMFTQWLNDAVNDVNNHGVYLLFEQCESHEVVTSLESIFDISLFKECGSEFNNVKDMASAYSKQSFCKILHYGELRPFTIGFFTDLTDIHNNNNDENNHIQNITSENLHIIQLFSMIVDNVKYEFNRKNHPDVDAITKILTNAAVMDNEGIRKLSVKDLEVVWDVIKSHIYI